MLRMRLDFWWRLSVLAGRLSFKLQRLSVWSGARYQAVPWDEEQEAQC